MPYTQAELEKLTKPHEDIEDHGDDYELYVASYVGGSEYREMNYIKKHTRESKQNYQRRVAESTFVNYSAPTVDIYNAYLYKETPQRRFEGAIADSDTLAAFLEDADLQGRSFRELIPSLSRWASVYGHYGVIVDKQRMTDALSREEEIKAGLRPYLTYYKPTDIVNWSYDFTYNGPPELDKLVLREHSSDANDQTAVYKIWERHVWSLYRATTVSGNAPQFELIDEGENKLGDIPFVMIINRDAFERMRGLSDISDIAEVNKNIYRIDSAANEIIEDTAFPFLETPVDPTGVISTEDVTIGTGNALPRDINDTVGHRWIETSGASLQQLATWRAQAVADIQFMSKMGEFSGTTRQGASATSGIAMDARYQQLNAILTEKARKMEYAERRILQLVIDLEGGDGSVTVKYPRKFGIRDVVHDLDTAIRAKDLIVSPVYDKMIQKSIASRTLSDMGFVSKDIDKAEEDIDQYAYIPSSQQFSLAGGMNGVSVVETKQSAQQQRTEAINTTTAMHEQTQKDGEQQSKQGVEKQPQDPMA